MDRPPGSRQQNCDYPFLRRNVPDLTKPNSANTVLNIVPRGGKAMTLPPNTRARLHLSGDIDIENVDNSGAVSPSPETETVTLTGRVLQPRTGTALRGLRVFATACVGPEEPIHLGAATSGADGRFRIQFEDRAEVKERLLALLHLPDSRLMLRIESPEGKALLKSAPVPLGRE